MTNRTWSPTINWRDRHLGIGGGGNVSPITPTTRIKLRILRLTQGHYLRCDARLRRSATTRLKRSLSDFDIPDITLAAVRSKSLAHPLWRVSRAVAGKNVDFPRDADGRSTGSRGIARRAVGPVLPGATPIGIPGSCSMPAVPSCQAH